MPWYAEVFEEVAEKVKADAKIEIEAFVTMKIMQLGLKELQKEIGSFISIEDKDERPLSSPTI